MSGIKRFIEILLVMSEKSANIARICREDTHLLSLLTQEKKDHEKNPRLLHDFKTLVDVLVQQLIKFEIEQQYPELKECVYGEENHIFTNTAGSEVEINVCENEATNLSMLINALNGKTQAAKLLNEQIHSAVSLNDVPIDEVPKQCPDIPMNQLAVWIDPIDATTEYINGIYEDYSDMKKIPENGLFCVTVLIGVFNRETGEPIIGIINQPFYSRINNEWKGKCVWGLSYQNYRTLSIPSFPVYEEFKNLKVIAVSSGEDESTKIKLAAAGYTLFAPSGAGYKLLCVILNVVDGYVLSKSTTYYWDTCACNAILKALGGSLWNYACAVKDGKLQEISYTKKTRCDIGLYCNNAGVIAARSLDDAKMIVEILRK